MRPLSDTLSRLSRMRQQTAGGDRTVGGSLSELSDFGANPGALRGWLHVPHQLPKDAALVVVLHGCTQTAAAYDHGSGWSQLADRLGFVVLFPEQQRQNNPNLCFNWFNPADIRRDSGEAASIRQMIEAVGPRHAIDPGKVFVTGLSAGGAMANVMLAAYPEVFSGGAIIAGLPYGSAGTIPEAFDRMRGHGCPSDAELVARARGASDYRGPWPTVSVWQGESDTTVSPSNAQAIVAQWRGLHGLEAAPAAVVQVDGARRSVWRDAAGREVIERFDIPGMGHGTPLKSSGADGCGAPGPFMLEAGISSTTEICRFWGLLGDDKAAAVNTPRAEPREPKSSLLPVAREPALQRIHPPKPRGKPAVGEIIEDALRKAGLMR